MPVILSVPLPGPFRYIRRLRRSRRERRSRGQVAAATVLGLTGAWFLVAAARLVLALYRPLILACQLAWQAGRRASLRWPALNGWAWAAGIFTALGVADSPWWGIGSAAAGAVWLLRMRRGHHEPEPAGEPGPESEIPALREALATAYEHLADLAERIGRLEEHKTAADQAGNDPHPGGDL